MKKINEMPNKAKPLADYTHQRTGTRHTNTRQVLGLLSLSHPNPSATHHLPSQQQLKQPTN